MIKISEEVIQLIIKNQKKCFDGVISPAWGVKDQVRKHFKGLTNVETHLKEIRRFIPLNKKMKILDLGCGYGYFVALLHRKGYRVWGCDADGSSIAIAQKILADNKINDKTITKNGRQLPYPNESFDFVYLSYVLSYVRNPARFFKEIRRVIKKGGQAYLVTVNYQCCYEPNYGVFLIPWLPRWLNKFYIRLLGRKDSFLDTLSFTTKNSLESIFKENNFEFENIGQKEWLRLLDKPDFFGRSQAYRKMITVVKKFHLEPFIKKLADWGFYTPLVYILEKTD